MTYKMFSEEELSQAGQENPKVLGLDVWLDVFCDLWIDVFCF